jgi:hypothetical protein
MGCCRRLPRPAQRVGIAFSSTGFSLTSIDDKALAAIEGLTPKHRKVSSSCRCEKHKLIRQAYGTSIFGITVKASVKQQKDTVSALQELRYSPAPVRPNSAGSSRPSAASNRTITQHASTIKEPRTNLTALSAFSQTGNNNRLAQRTASVAGSSGSGLKLAKKPQGVKSKF